MRTTRRIVQGAMLGAGVIGAAVAATPERGAGRWLRRATSRLASDARYMAAAVPGFTYRITGAHPDPDVGDDVIAERVRARLGLITTHLGIPPMRVQSVEHVVILEGAVQRRRDAEHLERAAMAVRGVHGVESHIHEDDALMRSDEPAAAVMPSLALAELCEAAGDAGARDERGAVHAVLCAFTDRLPAAARIELAAHLPADVRALIAPARHHGARLAPPRTVADLVRAVLAADDESDAVATDDAYAVTAAVVSTLRGLVPEATGAMVAALPQEIADLWLSTSPANA